MRDPATGGWRWYLVRAVPLMGRDGKPEEWISLLTDIHDRKMAQDRREMMIGEARHRLKNLLTIIDSLAKSSRPREADAGVDAFLKKFLGRLHAAFGGERPDAGQQVHAHGHGRAGARDAGAVPGDRCGAHPLRRARAGGVGSDRRRAGAGPARACHQCGEIRRAVGAGAARSRSPGASCRRRPATASCWTGRRPAGPQPVPAGTGRLWRAGHQVRRPRASATARWRRISTRKAFPAGSASCGRGRRPSSPAGPARGSPGPASPASPMWPASATETSSLPAMPFLKACA